MCLTERSQSFVFDYSVTLDKHALDEHAEGRARTAPAGAVERGTPPGGCGERGGGAGRSARRAPGGAPISPPVTGLATLPRRVAAAKGRLRSARASGALADNRGYRPRNG